MIPCPDTYIGWHCKACGFQHLVHKNEGTCVPFACVHCGSASTVRGHRVLPHNLVRCDSSPRVYDLCSDKGEIQLYFVAMTGERCGALFPPGEVPDTNDDPIAVADAALDWYNAHYVISSTKGELSRVITAMRICRKQSERNERLNRIYELQKQIALARWEYESLCLAVGMYASKKRPNKKEESNG